MLNWSNLFNIFCFLDSNQYQSSSTFDCILAIGSTKDIQLNTLESFSELKLFSNENKDWLFGHFNYSSAQNDEIGFPTAFFFIPQILIQISGNTLVIESDSEEIKPVKEKKKKLIIEDTTPISSEEFILLPNKKKSRKRVLVRDNKNKTAKKNKNKRRLLIVDSSSTEKI